MENRNVLTMEKNNIETYIAYGAIILSAIFMRLMPHAPNVAPIAALALFSGVKVSGWKSFLAPLIAMVISDFFLGFHATIPFVYGSFLLIVGIGYLLRKSVSPVTVGLGSLSGSILFFIITNFGAWITSSMYEKNINGLLRSYEMGLPFFRNTILGDLFFISVFFLGFRILTLLFVLMLPARRKTARHVGNTV